MSDCVCIENVFVGRVLAEFRGIHDDASSALFLMEVVVRLVHEFGHKKLHDMFLKASRLL